MVVFETKDITIEWENTVVRAENELMEMLLIGLSEKMLSFEERFWRLLGETEATTDSKDLVDWWVKLSLYLEKNERK